MKSRTVKWTRFAVSATLVVAASSQAGCKKNLAASDAGIVDDGGDLAGDSGLLSDAASAETDASDANDELRLPPAASDDLTARGKHLLEAISTDNPELAGDITLPRDAFTKLRSENDPTKVYDRKIAPAFARAIHLLHKRTKQVEAAQFVSFEIGGSLDQGSQRRREWKRPVWHAHHAKLVITVPSASGTAVQERIDVAELIAWRGAWYVLRLR